MSCCGKGKKAEIWTKRVAQAKINKIARSKRSKARELRRLARLARSERIAKRNARKLARSAKVEEVEPEIPSMPEDLAEIWEAIGIEKMSLETKKKYDVLKGNK
jgi:hypothetical protein